MGRKLSPIEREIVVKGLQPWEPYGFLQAIDFLYCLIEKPNNVGLGRVRVDRDEKEAVERVIPPRLDIPRFIAELCRLVEQPNLMGPTHAPVETSLEGDLETGIPLEIHMLLFIDELHDFFDRKYGSTKSLAVTMRWCMIARFISEHSEKFEKLGLLKVDVATGRVGFGAGFVEAVCKLPFRIRLDVTEEECSLCADEVFGFVQAKRHH